MERHDYYICPTCGEAWLDSAGEYATNGSIVYVDAGASEEDKDADAEALLGNWFYTSETSSSNGTYDELYVTIEKYPTADPTTYKVTSYLRKYDKGILKTKLDNSVDVDKTEWTGTGTVASPKTLTVTKAVNGEALVLTCIASGSAEWNSTSKTTDLGAYTVTLGSTIGTVAKISKLETEGHVFEIMDDLQAITGSCHYVECTVEGCGLTHVAVTHKAGCECGYGTGTWCKIMVDTAETNIGGVDIFYVLEDKVLTLETGKEWIAFNGAEYTIKGVYSDADMSTALPPETGSESTYKITAAAYIKVKATESWN